MGGLDPEEKERIKTEAMRSFYCGVLFDMPNKIWLIHTHKLLYDFDKAKERLIKEMESGNEKLIRNFNKVINAINIEDFKI